MNVLLTLIVRILIVKCLFGIVGVRKAEVANCNVGSLGFFLATEIKDSRKIISPKMSKLEQN